MKISLFLLSLLTVTFHQALTESNNPCPIHVGSHFRFSGPCPIDRNDKITLVPIGGNFTYKCNIWTTQGYGSHVLFWNISDLGTFIYKDKDLLSFNENDYDLTLTWPCPSGMYDPRVIEIPDCSYAAFHLFHNKVINVGCGVCPEEGIDGSRCYPSIVKPLIYESVQLVPFGPPHSLFYRYMKSVSGAIIFTWSPPVLPSFLSNSLVSFRYNFVLQEISASGAISIKFTTIVTGNITVTAVSTTHLSMYKQYRWGVSAASVDGKYGYTRLAMAEKSFNLPQLIFNSQYSSSSSSYKIKQLGFIGTSTDKKANTDDHATVLAIISTACLLIAIAVPVIVVILIIVFLLRKRNNSIVPVIKVVKGSTKTLTEIGTQMY